MTKRKTTCFISSPSVANLGVLKSILDEKGIKTLTASELIPGYDLSEQIAEAIAKSDLLIALFQSDPMSPNVCFELGLAFGLKKHILMISSPLIASVPTDLKGILHIRADLDNRDAIAFAVNQTLAAPPRKISKAIKPLGESKPIGKEAKSLLSQFDSLGAHIQERQIVQILLAAIQLSGISIFARSEAREIGADIALWADELAPSFKNPFLIEIKRSLVTRNQVEMTINQIGRYLGRDSGNAILILYVSGNHLEISRLVSVHPGVFAMPIRDFLVRLERESLAEIIADVSRRKMY